MNTSTQPTRKWPMLIALIGLIAVGLYAFRYVSQRKVSSADGSYYNVCCGLVRIKGGFMQTDRGFTKIRQEVMKYGLEVYPESDPRIFASDGGRTKGQLASLIFDENSHPQYFETADLHAHVYRFYRM